MIYNHEAGRWEPENEEEAEEYAAYMQETMGGHLLSDDDLREIEERFVKPDEYDDMQPFTRLGYDAGRMLQARTDIPALVAEVRRLRGELQFVHDLYQDAAIKCDRAQESCRAHQDARRAAEVENERLRWELVAERASYDSLEENREIVETENDILRAENERLMAELEVAENAAYCECGRINL